MAALNIAGGVLTGIYDGVGIWFLVKDYEVVHSCHASNPKVHVVWNTNVWTYVLASVILATGALAVMMVVPLKKGFQSMQKQMKKYKRPPRRGGMGNRTIKWGLVDGLPDWLFLMHGFAMMLLAIVFGIMAFCGYYELFEARPWCDDPKTAFEELHIWHFGRITFFIQLVLAVVFFIWGLTWWAMPFLFELTQAERPLLDSQA